MTEEGLTAQVTFEGMAQGEVLSPLKFVYTQDPLVRWLSKHGRGKKVQMEYEGEVRTVEVVSLHFCDDMNLYGGTLQDLQHNLGIVAEFARATGLKLNGAKSAYLTTDCEEGVTPDVCPTLDGEWTGGCDGTFEPRGGGEGDIRPREWDEAVRTLGVWRAISGKNERQSEVLLEAVETVRARAVGAGLTISQVRYVVNAVLCHTGTVDRCD